MLLNPARVSTAALSTSHAKRERGARDAERNTTQQPGALFPRNFKFTFPLLKAVHFLFFVFLSSCLLPPQCLRTTARSRARRTAQAARPRPRGRPTAASGCGAAALARRRRSWRATRRPSWGCPSWAPMGLRCCPSPAIAACGSGASPPQERYGKGGTRREEREREREKERENERKGKREKERIAGKEEERGYRKEERRGKRRRKVEREERGESKEEERMEERQR